MMSPATRAAGKIFPARDSGMRPSAARPYTYYPRFNSNKVISGGEPKRTGEKIVPMPRLT